MENRGRKVTGNSELSKQRKSIDAKRYREYIKTLSPEQKEQMKADKEARKWEKIEAKKERERIKVNKANCKRELDILQYMLKTDVLYYHHKQADSYNKEIQKRIDWLKKNNKYEEYDPYYWNWNSKQTSYKPLSFLGFLFRSNFEDIYEVPLDGSYTFYAYDNGSRGLGTFSTLTVRRTEDESQIPYVNPGALIPVTSL